MLISLGEWTLQTSVLLFVAAVAALLVALYLLIGMLRGLFGVPRRMRRWTGDRRQRRARSGLIDGIVRLVEGRYGESEKLLLKHIDRSDAPLLHYLAAAVIAQHRGSYEDRDRFLGLADRTSPRARLAVGLIQAQLQVDAGQWEQAFATLTYLHELSPNNPRVLSMLFKCCQALGEWERLQKLLPDLRRHAVLAPARLEELEREVAAHRLEQGRRNGLPGLEQVWNSLPRSLKDDGELLLIYADGAAALGNDDEAERVLRARLAKGWDRELVLHYGALAVTQPERALAQIEKWLKERPEDPALLHAAGRQALRAELWGRARTYLEAAVAREPRSDAYHALGALLERMGEVEAARDCYRRALEASASAALTPAEREALENAGRRLESRS